MTEGKFEHAISHIRSMLQVRETSNAERAGWLVMTYACGVLHPGMLAVLLLHAEPNDRAAAGARGAKRFDGG